LFLLLFGVCAHKFEVVTAAMFLLLSRPAGTFFVPAFFCADQLLATFFGGDQNDFSFFVHSVKG